MTNADPIPSTERRIEQATDAIRSMSQDLADEVSPRPAWINRVSNGARGAHSIAGDCIFARRDCLASVTVVLLSCPQKNWVMERVRQFHGLPTIAVFQEWRNATAADFFISARY
jgi:hypothetical protein